ncbi:hypothetical protein BH20ACT21_BH20ACT21_12350 [soil metagenome]
MVPYSWPTGGPLIVASDIDDGNGTTVEMTTPVTNELGTKDKCFTVVEAPGLRVRVTTHRSGRHWSSFRR